MRRPKAGDEETFRIVNIGNVSDLKAMRTTGQSGGAGKANYSPFIYACIKGNIELVEHLSSKNEKVVREKIRDNGFTAIHIAAATGDEAIFNFAVRRGLLNSVASEKLTALHVAIKEQNNNIVKKLLSVGADMNAQASNGFTPLHFAAFTANIEAVRLLISYSSTERPLYIFFDNTHKSPLQIAHLYAAEHSMEIMSIINNEVDFFPTLLYYEATEQYAMFDELHRYVPDLLEKRDIFFRNLVHVACINRAHRLLKWALSRNVPCDTPDKEGNYPLHYAVEEADVEAVDMVVLKYPHAVNAKNSRGFTPLDICQSDEIRDKLTPFRKIGPPPGVQGSTSRGAAGYGDQGHQAPLFVPPPANTYVQDIPGNTMATTPAFSQQAFQQPQGGAPQYLRSDNNMNPQAGMHNPGVAVDNHSQNNFAQDQAFAAANSRMVGGGHGTATPGYGGAPPYVEAGMDSRKSLSNSGTVNSVSFGNAIVPANIHPNFAPPQTNQYQAQMAAHVASLPVPPVPLDEYGLPYEISSPRYQEFDCFGNMIGHDMPVGFDAYGNPIFKDPHASYQHVNSVAPDKPSLRRSLKQIRREQKEKSQMMQAAASNELSISSIPPSAHEVSDFANQGMNTGNENFDDQNSSYRSNPPGQAYGDNGTRQIVPAGTIGSNFVEQASNTVGRTDFADRSGRITPYGGRYAGPRRQAYAEKKDVPIPRRSEILGSSLRSDNASPRRSRAATPTRSRPLSPAREGEISRGNIGMEDDDRGYVSGLVRDLSARASAAARSRGQSVDATERSSFIRSKSSVRRTPIIPIYNPKGVKKKSLREIKNKSLHRYTSPMEDMAFYYDIDDDGDVFATGPGVKKSQFTAGDSLTKQSVDSAGVPAYHVGNDMIRDESSFNLLTKKKSTARGGFSKDVGIASDAGSQKRAEGSSPVRDPGDSSSMSDSTEGYPAQAHITEPVVVDPKNPHIKGPIKREESDSDSTSSWYEFSRSPKGKKVKMENHDEPLPYEVMQKKGKKEKGTDTQSQSSSAPRLFKRQRTVADKLKEDDNDIENYDYVKDVIDQINNRTEPNAARRLVIKKQKEDPNYANILFNVACLNDNEDVVMFMLDDMNFDRVFATKYLALYSDNIKNLIRYYDRDIPYKKLRDAYVDGGIHILKQLSVIAPKLFLQKDDQPILHLAARSNDISAIHFLCNFGVDPNMKDEKGQTALHVAAEFGKSDSVHELCGHGVDPTIRDSRHRRAIDLCEDQDALRDFILHYTEKYGKTRNESQRLERLKNMMHVYDTESYQLRRCIDEGLIDINERDNNQQTCLMHAAIAGRANFIEFLKTKRNINMQDMDGNTALNLSLINGNYKFAEELLSRYYKEISIKKNRFKEDATDLIIKNKVKNSTIVIRALYATDRDSFGTVVNRFINCQMFHPDMQDKDGNTLLHLLVQDKKVSRIKALANSGVGFRLDITNNDGKDVEDVSSGAKGDKIIHFIRRKLIAPDHSNVGDDGGSLSDTTHTITRV